MVVGGAAAGQAWVSYAPVVEALRDLLAAVPAAAMVDLPARCGELVRLLPDLAVRVPTLAGPTRADAGTEQRLLFEGVVAVLQRCEPALVVLDDLQWADVGTLDLVSYLATAGDLDDVVMVGTARPMDLRPEVSGRLAELARHVDTARMHLDGLPTPDVRELVVHIYNTAVSEELVEAVTQAAEGNPLFVEELTAHLIDTGAAERVPAGEAAEMLRAEIPQRVRDMVGHRVAKLASPTSAMVRAGAVFGREFNVAMAAEAAGLAGHAVVPAADEALGCGVVVESDPGMLAFPHSLIHNAVVGQLSRLARAEPCTAGRPGSSKNASGQTPTPRPRYPGTGTTSPGSTRRRKPPPPSGRSVPVTLLWPRPQPKRPSLATTTRAAGGPPQPRAIAMP